MPRGISKSERPEVYANGSARQRLVDAYIDCVKLCDALYVQLKDVQERYATAKAELVKAGSRLDLDAQ